MSRPVREERLSGERLFTGRVVALEVDRVALPGGGETIREVVRHRGAVVILPLLDDGQVVLVRQFRYPVGEVLLELPAGKLEPGEDRLDCARRELAEETGWAAGELYCLGTFYTTPGFSDEVLHCYVATGLRAAGPAIPDPDEELEVVVLSTAELRRLVFAGEISDGKTLTLLLLGWLHGWLEPAGLPPERLAVPHERKRLGQR